MGTTIAIVQDAASADGCIAWTRLLAPAAPGNDGEAEPAVEYLCNSPQGEHDTSNAVRALLGEGEHAVTELPRIESMGAAIERARSAHADLIVSCVANLPRDFATTTAKRLLQISPCATFVLLSGDKSPRTLRRVLAIVSGSAHDGVVFDLARRLTRGQSGGVTLATIEDDVERGAEEVGARDLQQFLRQMDADKDASIRTKVIVDNHPVRGVVRAFDGHDLVLVGASSLDLVKNLQGALGGAAVGLLKRRPPLRRRSLPDWIPQVSPADYAELAQSLRQGSRWNADFVVMLGLASAIASLGLIQDSAAVVIGSMLLAPLMTPMLGFGLALAQANSRMARLSGRSILQGSCSHSSSASPSASSPSARPCLRKSSRAAGPTSSIWGSPCLLRWRPLSPSPAPVLPAPSRALPLRRHSSHRSAPAEAPWQPGSI